MKQSQQNYKRIVVKVGSSLFYQKDKLDFEHLSAIISQVSRAAKAGKEVVIVSSGAIALGMSILKLAKRPKELSYLQACAAIGQHELMELYRRCFREHQINCAQVLLTWEDFSERKRYLNAKNTLFTLLKLGSVPVINENDTISTEEIKFGDNDRLSALVAVLTSADLLIILSDVDGLLDEEKKLVRVVPEINSQIRGLACPTQRGSCVGGMITKIEAAKIAVDSGIPCVIANGRAEDIILKVSGGQGSDDRWTVFLPKKGFLAERQRWIAFGTKTKGIIFVDDGAKKALLDKKSLLSVGVSGIDGEFEAGKIVSVRDSRNSEFARGKVNVSSGQLFKVMGKRFDREIIHRDNIVIL